MRNWPFARRKCSTAIPTNPPGAKMNLFTKRKAKYSATLAVALSCVAGLALASGTSGALRVQTSEPEDVASAKSHEATSTEDRSDAFDRDMLEEKLILHGQLSLRARAREYACGSQGEFRFTKQDPTMKTLADSAVAPATSFARNRIDAQFVISGGL